MKTSITKFAITLAAAAILMGCATVPVEKSFRQVAEHTETTTGQSIQWVGVTTQPEEVDEPVASMLEGGLTADEATRIAVLNNPRLQAVYEQYGIARAELVKAGLPRNPLFRGDLLYENSSSQTWELEVAQDLLSVFLIPLRRSVAKANLDGAGMAVTAAVIDVAMDTRRAFLHYQADAQVFELWKDLLLAEEAGFEMTVKLREAGNIAQDKVAAAQGRYEDAKLMYAAAQVDLEASRERVNRLMGLFGKQAAWKAADNLPDSPPEPTYSGDMERRAVENSIDLAIAWLDTKAAAQRSGITNVEAIFPELEGGIKLESNPPEGGARHWEVGPVLDIPIPLFDQGQPARAISRGEVRERWDIYTALAAELRSATRAAVHKTDVTRASAAYDKRVNLPVARHELDQAQLRYNAMFLGPVDLLRVKQREIEANMTYVRSLLEYWLARTDLEQIMLGRLVVRAPGDRPDIIGADIRRASIDPGGSQ